MLQSQYGSVKVNLKDGRVRPVIPRGSEPSSFASTTTPMFVDSQVPSELSSDYVLNWVEALATIDCLMMNVEMPFEEIDKDSNPSIAQSIEEIPQPETPEEMLEAFRMDELKEEGEQEFLQLCYLAEPESPEEETLRKEEANSRHNIPTKPAKKERKASKNGVIMEKMT